MQGMLVKNVQPEYSQPKLDDLMRWQEKQQQASTAAFISQLQLRMMKEIMSIMQPQAAPVLPVQAPAIMQAQLMQPPPPVQHGTFDLDTMERLAKMFK